MKKTILEGSSQVGDTPERSLPTVVLVPEVETTESHEDVASRTRRLLTTGMWWGVTLVTLVVLDDLTFGPIFWILARTAGPAAAVFAVFAVYVPLQVFLVRRATEPHPGRVASYLLARLELQRRSEQVSDREKSLQRRVVGGASAVAMSLVIGGVLPLLILWRHGHPRRMIRRLSYLTATIYATEFALLHGLLPAAF